MKEVHISCRIKNTPWVLSVDMDCLTKSKPFELNGDYYYIVSFNKKMKEHLNIIKAYDCKVISQEKWRDNQLKKILN